MANVLFTRKSGKSAIDNVPIIDGQLLFDTSGNGKMYLDNGTNRLEMGGSVTVDSKINKTSTNPIQNKAVGGVMLSKLSDVANTTTEGFITDALATKELNNKLSNVFKAKVTGTLTAGQTSIKLTNSAITTNSRFDFYTSIYGVSPTNVEVASGSITLEFDAQETNMNVEVRVS